jgi:hypothetical protein
VRKPSGRTVATSATSVQCAHGRRRGRPLRRRWSRACDHGMWLTDLVEGGVICGSTPTGETAHPERESCRHNRPAKNRRSRRLDGSIVVDMHDVDRDDHARLRRRSRLARGLPGQAVIYEVDQEMRPRLRRHRHLRASGEHTSPSSAYGETPHRPHGGGDDSRAGPQVHAGSRVTASASPAFPAGAAPADRIVEGQ